MRFAFFSFVPMTIAYCLMSACICGSSIAYAAGADYDGNGFSEIPVLATDDSGSYTWTLFDPFSGTSNVFTKSFGNSSSAVILANWLYPNVTSAGVVSRPTSHSGRRLVWRIRTSVRARTRVEKERARASGFVIKEQKNIWGAEEIC